MYHYHNTRRPPTANTTHPVLSHLNHPCIHSPQSSILSFCTPHPFSLPPGDVGAWVILWLVECFRIHVQSGCPCPSFSSVPTVFRIDCNPCSLSLEHSPHTRDLHHPFSFISTPSSTYQFPLRNLHTFELSPPFPPTPSRLINHLPFHNRSAQHLCIFLAILFSQFYCTTVLFVLHPSPPLSARGRRHPKLAL